MALAMIMRSPKSWLTSRRYGVSPQPPHAPENSNSGSSTWLPLTVSWAMRLRSSGGIVSKKSQRTRSASRWAMTGSMSMALWLESVLLLAGQTSTQTPQPVQSSGATWIVSRWSARSRERKSLDLKPSGAPARSAVGKTFIRIVAWGQTIAHLPQSMQMDGSQTGIVWAIARFSYFAVPVGNVPSTGRALTGSRSPSPAMSRAVTRATKSGTPAGMAGTAGRSAAIGPGVTFDRRASERSMASKLRATTASPRFA